MGHIETNVASIRDAYDRRVPVENAQNDWLMCLENHIQRNTDMLGDVNGMIQGIDNQLGVGAAPLEQAESRPHSQADSHWLVHMAPSFHEIPQSTHWGDREPERIPKEAQTKIPNAFDGKYNWAAKVFMMKMESYFSDYEAFNNERRRMRIFWNNMAKGEAENWAQLILQRYSNGSWLGKLRLCEDLKEEFLRFFDDPTKEQKAINDIHKLKQVGLAQHYTNQFHLLAEDLGWDEKALIDRYKAGLKGSVQVWLTQAGLGRNPQELARMTLNDWMHLAIQTDDLLYSSQNLGNTSNPLGIQRRTESGKAGNTSKTTSDWQVIQSIIDKHKAANTCIKCGKKGHQMHTCLAKHWETKDLDEGKEKGKATTIDETTGDDSSSTVLGN